MIWSNVIGIGVDIVSTKRMLCFLDEHQHSLDKFFTQEEISYCSRYREPVQHYAARFAAKEAVMKALGIGIFEVGSLKNIGVENLASGAPITKTYGVVTQLIKKKGIYEIHLSLSHCSEYAIAQALALADGRG
jgi:holo-[acyl-carrier protein] synthase